MVNLLFRMLIKRVQFFVFNKFDWARVTVSRAEGRAEAGTARHTIPKKGHISSVSNALLRYDSGICIVDRDM